MKKLLICEQKDASLYLIEMEKELTAVSKKNCQVAYVKNRKNQFGQKKVLVEDMKKKIQETLLSIKLQLLRLASRIVFT